MINRQGPGALDRSKRMIPLQLKRARPKENRINSGDKAMTEAGEQWVIDHTLSEEWESSTATIPAEAEFWLRALGDELKKRYDQDPSVDFGDLYHETMRELLGDE